MELILNHESSLTRRHHHPTKAASDGHSEAGGSRCSSSSLSQSPLAQLEQKRDECIERNNWNLAFVYAQHAWCFSLKEQDCEQILQTEQQRDVLTTILRRVGFGPLEISKYLQILQQYTLTPNASQNELSLSYWNSRLHFFDSSLNGLARRTIEAAQVHTRLSQLHESKSLGKALLHAQAALRIYKQLFNRNHPDRMQALQRVQKLKQSIVDEQQQPFRRRLNSKGRPEFASGGGGCSVPVDVDEPTTDKNRDDNKSSSKGWIYLLWLAIPYYKSFFVYKNRRATSAPRGQDDKDLCFWQFHKKRSGSKLTVHLITYVVMHR